MLKNIFLWICLGCLFTLMSCASAKANETKTSPEVQNEVSESKSNIEKSSVIDEAPEEFKAKIQKSKTVVSSLYETQGGVVKSSEIMSQKQNADKLAHDSKVSSTKESSYTLQFEVVSDVDNAQKRRWAVSQKTGLGAYLLFDSPFYKIRGGKWSNRSDAEDAALQYNAMGIAAILIEL
jgi:methionine-rich copper-binding protein CopC